MCRHLRLLCAVLISPLAVKAQTVQSVIDVHQHAIPADFWSWASAGGEGDPAWFRGLPPRAETDQDLMEETLAAMDRHHIVKAVFSGSPDWVAKWVDAAPHRVLRGSNFADACGEVRVAALRELHGRRGYEVMGEASWAFAGIAPDDARVEPCFALAEELDVPLGIHMGPGFPGAYRLGYRSSATRPLLLEAPLAKHPDVRVYVMHAGWPFIDETIALMQGHPSVYADLSLIDWFIPEKAFHHALRRLIDAGLGDRLMYGSDAGVWPGAIDLSLERIRSAGFLTEQERRAILHDNAARFLRLEGEG